MILTADQLRRIMQAAGPRADTYAPLLTAAAEKFRIDTPTRMAAWLAQLAHESGQLVYTRELASGDAYEGRKDLGNDQPGDGHRFRGRGLIQITGRHNYQLASAACDTDYVNHPEWMERPADACMVSGWYWEKHGLSMLADVGDFDRITRIINGGTNGAADRRMFWQRAKTVLEVDRGVV